MASIAETDVIIASSRRAARPLRVVQLLYRQLRRRWNRRLWAAQMRRELGDDRLLADIGVPAGVERQRLAALARALGASWQREI